MSYLSSNYGFSQPLGRLPACMITSPHNLSAAETGARIPDTSDTLLQGFTQDIGNDIPEVKDTADFPPLEAALPLEKVEAGPWRSLGGYLDYSNWSSRERFLELDRMIADGQNHGERKDEPDTYHATTPPFRVVIEDSTSRGIEPVHPVPFLDVARNALRIDSLDEMIKFIMASQGC